MGGKGSGGGSGMTQRMINEQAFDAGAGGMKWNNIQGSIPFGHDQALESWMQGQQAGAGGGGGFGFDFGGFEMPHFGGGDESSYEERMAQQQAMFDQQQADAARIQGENQRDQLYSAYMDAAGSATDFVNSEVMREEANARLLGIDYTLTDELKSQRVSDYFATVWGEGEQQQLEALMGKWGNPEGFSGYTVTRGDASKYAGTPGEETTKAVAGGQTPKPTLATDEEELGLGGGATILGV